MSFDPTSNLVGGDNLISVGVARHASLGSPMQGVWNVRMDAFLGMDADVQLHTRANGSG